LLPQVMAASPHIVLDQGCPALTTDRSLRGGLRYFNIR
jgi:hypothetical protein